MHVLAEQFAWLSKHCLDAGEGEPASSEEAPVAVSKL